MAAKEHISITLDEEVISWLDKKINGYGIKNRSHAIEKILLKSMNEECIKQAVILCGGGKNEPLRAMTLIDGKPALEHTLMYLKMQGISDILLIVNYDYEKIISYFGKGTKYDLNIRYIIEDEPGGTAGFLKSARGMIFNTFVLMYGDVLLSVDLNDMLKVHRNSKAIATMALTTSTDTSSYGVVKLKGEKITEFIEKPGLNKSQSNLINAGVFIIEPQLPELLFEEGEKIILENIFVKLCSEGKLAGYVYDGTWTHLEKGGK
ncbi:MAG: hypothetical protein DRN66_04165 [Candidatus Nanohalarchaeota archaeon]|nr:MAG: hypothetical protein DRN66_04165 [Candidatus Nanohaloarchaeota archaeon]